MAFDVSHIAKLANLPLSKEEKEKFEKQLDETLSTIANLKEVDTTKSKETPQVTGLENVTRPDTVSLSLSQEEALKGAKKTHNGFFVTEAVLNQE